MTAKGEILLVTVDGRRRGWSAGMNMWELAHLMIDLGAVEALSLDGGGSTTATVFGQVRNRPSGSLRPVANALVVRHTYPFDHSTQIGGRDRYDTAARVALREFRDGVGAAVLTTGQNFPDALAGGPLAASLGVPLLLTGSTSLPASTKTALAELDVNRVIVLGGAAAVSKKVTDELATRGIRVERLQGRTRHDTAATIGERLVGSDRPDTVILASGRSFADALVAAAPAGQLNAPVLLTEPNQLPAATIAYLKDRTPNNIVIVGGDSVVSSAVASQVRNIAPLSNVQRLAGPDRYATASAITDWATERLGLGSRVVVARGDAFPDALSGGPYAAANDALLMIVPPGNALTSKAASSSWLEKNAAPLDSVHILGGSSIFSLYERTRLDQLISR